jgi:hypothetical protein
MRHEEIRKAMCRSFCDDIRIVEMRGRLIVSASSVSRDRDRISFDIVEAEDGFYLSDDGDFLATLEAMGIDTSEGPRAQFVNSILNDAGAFIPADDYRIRTRTFKGQIDPAAALRFLTALERIRDVSYWTKDVVRSTFKADATRALIARLSPAANVNTTAPVDARLADFPVDVVVSPIDWHHPDREPPKTAIYLANSKDSLSEATALWSEAKRLHVVDLKVVALLEDDRVALSNSIRFKRMLNRIDGVAVWSGDREVALDKVVAITGLDLSLPAEAR